MDEDRHIERQLSLWIRCEQLGKQKIGEDVPMSVTTEIYNQVNKWLLSDRITSEKKKTQQNVANGQDDDHCAGCGRELTHGEKNFLLDKKGQDRHC